MSGNEDASNDQSEVCYCKVKAFRDKEAKQKLSNDVAHVEKMIKKLKQQITQAEMDSGHSDKQKRRCTSKVSGNRIIKVPIAASPRLKIGRAEYPLVAWVSGDGKTQLDIGQMGRDSPAKRRKSTIPTSRTHAVISILR